MAVHTYIGARYVPRFTGVYDPTQIYEALDVVDNGSGTSYIARKTVPAGTPLTDSSFWFVYGASSGAIVQLQNDMIQAQNDITQAQSDISQAQSDISQSQSDISTLDARVDALETPDRRFILIADSYGEYPTAADSWLNLFKNMLPSTTYCFTTYEGSMGISRNGGHGHNVESLLRSESANITDHGTITDIVIGLGVNDYDQTLASVSTAYNSLYAYISSEYPNARVHMAFASYKGDFNRTERFTYIELLHLMQTVCAKFDKWRFCEGVEYIMHFSPFKQSDHVHPNTAGSQELANAIFYCVMHDKEYRFFKVFQSTFNLNGGSAVPYQLVIDNGIFSLLFTEALGLSAITIPASTLFLNIGQFTDIPVYNGLVSTVAHIKGSGGTIPDTVELLTSGANIQARFDLSTAVTLSGIRIESFLLTGETLLV